MVLQKHPGLHISLRTQHDTTLLHYSYLSTLQWAVDTADLDVAMFGPWDDLQSLKVTAQNHHITTWRIGLSRDKETAKGERDEDETPIHPESTTVSNDGQLPPYDSSGEQADFQFNSIQRSLSVARRRRSSHEPRFTDSASFTRGQTNRNRSPIDPFSK